ncbi:MAG TPA: hypothetical protein VJY33_09130 [Isosphaeraceae bacterium]|nr:hypothetical protein [Isosphaeraceae bacterium]
MTVAASLASADDCIPLTAYRIGSTGVVRLTWIQPAGAANAKNIRYTVLRGTLTDSMKVISTTANDPVTNVLLDQVNTPDRYTYQVQIDTLNPTDQKPSATSNTRQASVTVPSPLGTTLIAETFDGNRLDATVWSVTSGANSKIEDGLLMIGPGVTMSVTVPPPSSSVKLSANGLELVARVQVDSSYTNTSKKDQVAASIGFETTATSDGYVLKLALHDLCGSAKQVQLQYTPKQGTPSKLGTPIWIDNQPQSAAAAWDTGSYYWLKLKLDRQARKVLAWTWKDGDPASKIDDPTAAVSSLDLPQNLVKDPQKPVDPKTLDVKPELNGEAGAVSFGEVIIEDLPTAPAVVTTPPTTTYVKPEPPTVSPAKPPCLVASRPEPPSRPAPRLWDPPPYGPWPTYAVALVSNDTPGSYWKLRYRGLSVSPDYRTVEDEALLDGGSKTSDGFAQSNPDKSLGADAESRVLTDHHFVFLGPAMFPLPSFDGSCPTAEDDGAIIKESMHLRASDNGEFEVEFRVAAPATPTTLRLQLALRRGGQNLGSITLPPVILDQEKYNRTDDQDDTWRVVYHSFSRALAEALSGRDLPLEITRQGAARFGSGVSNLALSYD